MPIPLFMAMTAAELAGCTSFPKDIAWMACHFSPYGTGLSNFPESLPKDSVIIINDRIPIFHHSAQGISLQLQELVEQFSPAGILLDFQRENNPETAEVVSEILRKLPCPVAVSQHYAQGCHCPVFLPPVPVNIGAPQHLSPFQGREIWLEVDTDTLEFRITPKGCAVDHCMDPENSLPLEDKNLHCHYKIETGAEYARFLIKRTAEDLQALLDEAESLGVTKAFGLYQQLSKQQKPPC